MRSSKDFRGTVKLCVWISSPTFAGGQPAIIVQSESFEFIPQGCTNTTRDGARLPFSITLDILGCRHTFIFVHIIWGDDNAKGAARREKHTTGFAQARYICSQCRRFVRRMYKILAPVFFFLLLIEVKSEYAHK